MSDVSRQPKQQAVSELMALLHDGQLGVSTAPSREGRGVCSVTTEWVLPRRRRSATGKVLHLRSRLSSQAGLAFKKL